MSKSERDRESPLNLVRLPAELSRFLKEPSYSLAIKGRAGTGKTSLALSILSEVGNVQDRMYISTRMSTFELFKYHPWISTLAKGLDEGQSKVEELADESSIFIDARLDEPTAFFERITNELMDTSSPVIAIDTWDAIADFMDKEAFVTNAKILQVWRQRAQAKLIFTIENTEDKTFDNLVDGIVELEEGDVDSRKTRKIHLSKLRGTKVNHPWYMFSLNHGIFRSYEPYHPSDLSLFTPDNLVKYSSDPDQKLISTGYRKLDEILGGGIPKKSILYLTIDSDVDPRIGVSLIYGIIRQYSVSGNPVIIQPPTGVSSENLTQMLQEMLPDQKALRQIRIFSIEQVVSGKNPSNHIQSFDKMLAETQRKFRHKRLVCVLCFSPFDGELTKGSLELSKHSNYDLLALINSTSDHKLEKTKGVATVTLRLRKIEGTVFLQSDNPWTSFYALVPDQGKRIALDQMV